MVSTSASSHSRLPTLRAQDQPALQLLDRLLVAVAGAQHVRQVAVGSQDGRGEVVLQRDRQGMGRQGLALVHPAAELEQRGLGGQRLGQHLGQAQGLGHRERLLQMRCSLV
jgi:hypothetical protein